MNDIDEILKRYDSVLSKGSKIYRELGSISVPHVKYVELVDRLAVVHKNCKQRKAELLRIKLQRKINRNNEI